MFDINENMEDIIIEKMSIEELVKEFEPEVQEIFYEKYGYKLESMPMNLGENMGMEKVLLCLQRLRNSMHQKMILMRFGVVTGTPMTVEEVSEEFGITKERVRQIETRFLRYYNNDIRWKRLLEFVNDSEEDHRSNE